MSRISNRMKIVVALTALVAVVFLGLLVVLAVGPRVIPPPPPTGTPTAPPVPGAEELGNQFLISKVGEAYFRAHYRFEKAELTEWPGVVHLLYRYNYSPHVTDYQVSFFLDTQTNTIWRKYTQYVLLEPQEFRVTREQAIEIARDHGIQAPIKDLHIVVGLFPPDRQDRWRKRFYWSVSRGQDWDPPAPSVTVVRIDVETGDAFVQELTSLYLEPPREPGIDWLLIGAGGLALLGLSLIAGIAWKLRRRKKWSQLRKPCSE